MRRSDIETAVRNGFGDIGVGDCWAEVDTVGKSVKLCIPGEVGVVVEFDEEEWSVFYGFVVDVNNMVTW